MTPDAAWDALTAHFHEVDLLADLGGLAEWDQHVWMPPGGGPLRGQHKGLLAKLQHERLTDPRVADWLAALDGSEHPVRAAAVRNLGRTHRAALAKPSALVQAQAEATSGAFATWVKARQDEDVAAFAPALARVVELTRQEAACLADAADVPFAHPYDALLHQYDPGVTVADLDALFAKLSSGLVDLLDRIRGASQGPTAPSPTPVPVDVQRRIHRRVCEAMGFDMQRGRLDEAPHPFTMGMDPADVRLTTRYFADDLHAGLLGTIHEAGHGLYEQGLPAELDGLALAGTGVGSAASTGVHESQSRFWENTIGRSRPFQAWLAGVVAEETGQDVDAARLFAHANRVAPSFIRVEADEVTYNLHIALRFRLEVALLAGDLGTADLPGAWDDLCQELLGIRPERPSQGVLQDVHWSAGLIGYFPSYTLGNVYAAVLAERMAADLPDLWDRVGAADLAPVLGWLRTHVHGRGHLVDGALLIDGIAAGRDPVDAFLAHLQGRHGGLYGV
ncbi:MAG: carboxypeptidase M32 [Alphaproteobacteria bacterium]|nr:carboxypeptidase M32 [Alphaproteobacteria bacterium]